MHCLTKQLSQETKGMFPRCGAEHPNVCDAIKEELHAGVDHNDARSIQNSPLSGWSFRASLRCAFLSSCSLAFLSTPSRV